MSATVTVESLNKEIAERTALWTEAKKTGADAAVVEEHRVKLGELKKALGQLQAGAGGKDGKKRERLLLKTAKVRSYLSLRLSVYGVCIDV